MRTGPAGIFVTLTQEDHENVFDKKTLNCVHPALSLLEVKPVNSQTLGASIPLRQSETWRFGSLGSRRHSQC